MQRSIKVTVTFIMKEVTDSLSVPVNKVWWIWDNLEIKKAF